MLIVVRSEVQHTMIWWQGRTNDGSLVLFGHGLCLELGLWLFLGVPVSRLSPC